MLSHSSQTRLRTEWIKRMTFRGARSGRAFLYEPSRCRKLPDCPMYNTRSASPLMIYTPGLGGTALKKAAPNRSNNGRAGSNKCNCCSDTTPIKARIGLPGNAQPLGSKATRLFRSTDHNRLVFSHWCHKEKIK